MVKKWLWLTVSCLVAAAMLAVSCGPAAEAPEEEEPAVVEAPVTEEPAEEPAEKPAEPAPAPPTPLGQLPAPPPGAKMVMNSVGKMMEEPQYGGTMTIAATWSPDTQGFDPIRWSDLDGSAWFFLGMYETLAIGDYTKSIPGTGEWVSEPGEPTSWHWMVRLDNLRPRLAESWEISPDLLSVTIKIREGIHWHNKPPVNGREFTAYDVKYLFDRHWGTGSGFDQPDDRYGSVFSIFPSSVESVECPDKYTVVFTWTDPDMSRLMLIIGGGAKHASAMYPREILDTYGPTGLEDWRNMIGTGAFMVEDYVIESSLILEKNPDYWGEDELLPGNKLPYVDKLQFIIIADRSVNIAAFRVGKMDFGALLFLTPEEIEQLQSTNPDVYYTYYPMESNTCIYPKLEIEPYNDVRVRKALQMAIDIDQYNEVYPGRRIERICRPIMPPLGPDYWKPFEEFPEEIQENYRYDPERAKQLLADAGYPNGFKTVVAAWPGDVVTQIVQSQWEKIGVELEIRTVEGVAMGPMTWGRTYSDMITFQAHWSYVGSGLWQHLPGYPFPTADEEFIELVTEFYDTMDLLGEYSPELIDIAQRAEYIMLRDVYYFTVGPSRMTAQPHHPWVKNRWCYMPIDDHVPDLVARMWIDQDLKFKMTGRR